VAEQRGGVLPRQGQVGRGVGLGWGGEGELEGKEVHGCITHTFCLRCPLSSRLPIGPHLTTHPTQPRNRGTPLSTAYTAAIDALIDQHEASGGSRLGALLMEPVLQGAGGMLCVDPAFQRALVQVRGCARGSAKWACCC